MSKKVEFILLHTEYSIYLLMLRCGSEDTNWTVFSNFQRILDNNGICFSVLVNYLFFLLNIL